MSNSRKPSTASDSSTRSDRLETSGLRALAPKIRPIAPRPAPTQSITARPGAPCRRDIQYCRVCFKTECRLATHRAFGPTIPPHQASATGPIAAPSREFDVRFAASYAFTLAHQYVNGDTTDSKTDNYYTLPIRAELNTLDMHQLFHSFFASETQRNFRITRPSEIVGDLIFSPLFVPAMHDSALCLSVLATAAAVSPGRHANQERKITCLMLMGESMQQIQERIELDPQNTSDVTIVAATFLWLANIWLEDADALESYASNVVSFVNTRGGLKELGMVGAVAQFIRWTDIFSSLMMLQPCRFQDVQDPEATPSSLPQHYGMFWTTSLDPLAVRINPSIALTCQESCRLVENLESVGNGSPSARQYIFLVTKLCFLCTQDSVLRIKLHGTDSWEECILEALILVRIKSFCGNDRLTKLITKNAETLARALQRKTAADALWTANLDLMIWLLFAALLDPDISSAREWCLSLLLATTNAKFGNSAAWSVTWMADLNEVLRAFFWSESQLHTDFLRICELLMTVPPSINSAILYKEMQIDRADGIDGII